MSRSSGSWERWPLETKLLLLARLHRERWEKTARPEQRPPAGDWKAWYIRGGRGSGKTRTGAETLRDWIIDSPPGDWAVIAKNDRAARKVCMEGRHSGLIKAFGGYNSLLVKHYHRTDGTLILWNGSRVLIDGADDGAFNIQGENLSGAWCDEVGLWQAPYWDNAWNESLWPAVRMSPAKIVATGTPKMGHGLVKQLLKDPHVPVTHMRTIDNIANLPEEEVRELYERFAGTRRGRQELDGDFIEDVPGALWTQELIDRHRVSALPIGGLGRIVVGVDPSGAADEDTGANSIGIVVVGFSSFTGHGYVLGDYTLRGGPERWAREVCRVYERYNANKVVAEKNFGGAMVLHTLRTENPGLPVTLMNASEGKAARADPVSLLYDQGKVHHLRGPDLRKLEDQMTTWVPPRPGLQKQPSPDRMDALVWALTELMVDGPRGGASYPLYGDDGEYVVRRGDLVLRGEHHRDK